MRLALRFVTTTAPARARTRVMVTSASDTTNSLCQFIVLRKDLGRNQRWPLGALSAQVAHASVAAIWKYRENASTSAYCEDAANMRKVVLETKNENQLRALGEQLTAAGVEHCVWIEQPEDVATALATRPYDKEDIGHLFKKCNLAKDVCVSPSAAP